MSAGDFFGEIGILNLDGGVNRSDVSLTKGPGLLHLYVVTWAGRRQTRPLNLLLYSYALYIFVSVFRFCFFSLTKNSNFHGEDRNLLKGNES